MYFWNTRQLAFDLREGKVTERQQMWYVFAFVVFANPGIHVWARLPMEFSVSKMVAGVAEVVVTIIGLLACYQANSRGDGKDLVVRFICLSWPVGLRVLVCWLVLGYVSSLIVGFAVPMDMIVPMSTYAAPLVDLISVGVSVAYFALIRKWLMKISNPEIPDESSQSSLCREER